MSEDEHWPCPYPFCHEVPLLVGPNQSVISKHSYEGRGDCPGSGFDIKKPSAEQYRLMDERKAEMMKGESE